MLFFKGKKSFFKKIAAQKADYIIYLKSLKFMKLLQIGAITGRIGAKPAIKIITRKTHSRFLFPSRNEIGQGKGEEYRIRLKL